MRIPGRKKRPPTKVAVERAPINIRVVTPQFERTADMGPAASYPEDREAWDDLKQMTGPELRERGLYGWDEKLFLFPAEWYSHIPEGYVVDTINDRQEKFRMGVTDDDIRFGMLAYGVRGVKS